MEDISRLLYLEKRILLYGIWYLLEQSDSSLPGAYPPAVRVCRGLEVRPRSVAHHGLWPVAREGALLPAAESIASTVSFEGPLSTCLSASGWFACLRPA